MKKSGYKDKAGSLRTMRKNMMLVTSERDAYVSAYGKWSMRAFAQYAKYLNDMPRKSAKLTGLK